MSGRYTVTATRLNLRTGPGVEAPIRAVLPHGALVERVSDSPIPGWWQVAVVPGGQAGFVARQYVADQSATPARPTTVIDEVLWDRTTACAGRIAYLLGAKHSSSGQIDCSGWVHELTAASFDAINRAAAPDVAFHQADYRLFDTHSDGIIAGIEGRTHFALHGNDVRIEDLRSGMLIGCNFGDYGWERSSPPRTYGIDHIVQVMADPENGAYYITQSSSSGHGVNKVPLGDWLDGRRRQNMMYDRRIHAVDPFLLMDRNVAAAIVQPSAPAIPAPSAPIIASPQAPAAPAFSFAGRSFFIYTASQLIAEFGSAAGAVAELRRCRADGIWVRIHGRGYVGDSKGASTQPLERLIAAARSAGIGLAGWGWCQGEDPVADAAIALQAIEHFGIDGYMADIEQDVNGSKWTAAEVRQFVAHVRAGAPTLPISLTSHGYIGWHSPELFDGVGPDLACVCPQAYWYESYPTAAMIDPAGIAAGYRRADPSSYAQVCADQWRRYRAPIVIAGQICPEREFAADDALAKLSSFLGSYRRPEGVIGESYWHFGAATREMRDALAAH